MDDAQVTEAIRQAKARQAALDGKLFEAITTLDKLSNVYAGSPYRHGQVVSRRAAKLRDGIRDLRELVQS